MKKEIVSGYYKSDGEKSFSIAGVVEMLDGESLSIAIVSENLSYSEVNRGFAESAVHAVIAFVQNSAEKEYTKLLFHAVSYANKVIYEKYGHNGVKGSLAVAIIPDGGRAYVANVGNSRIYLARRSKLTQLSLDHTVFNLLPIQEKMMLSEENVEMANDLFISIGAQPVVPVDVGLHFPEVSCKEEYLEAQERGKAGLELKVGDSIIVSSQGFQPKQSQNEVSASQLEMTASLADNFGDAAAERLSHLVMSREPDLNPSFGVLQLPSPAKTGYLQTVYKIGQRFSGVLVGALMTLLIFLSLTISSIIVMAWGQSNNELIAQLLPLFSGEDLFDASMPEAQTGVDRADGETDYEGEILFGPDEQPAIVSEADQALLPSGQPAINRAVPFYPKTTAVNMTIEEIFPNFGTEETDLLTVIPANSGEDQVERVADLGESAEGELHLSPQPVLSQPVPRPESESPDMSGALDWVATGNAERAVLVRLNIRTGPSTQAEIIGLLLPGEPFWPQYRYRDEADDVWLYGQARNSDLVGWVWAPGTEGGDIELIPPFLPAAVPLK